MISFLREECAYIPDASITAAELYNAYRKWCGETGHKALSSTSFAKQVLSAGKYFGRSIERVRVRTGTEYCNLLISNSPDGWEEIK